MLTHVLFTLTDSVAVVAVPGTCFVNQAILYAQIDELAFTRDALAIQDLKLSLLERWSHLVLDDFDACFVTDDFIAALDSADTAYIHPHGTIEFKRVTTCGGFWATKHDPDFHTDLVDKDNQSVRTLDIAGELT